MMAMTPNDLKRFIAKFAKGRPDDCWEWSSATDRGGYGRFRLDRKLRLAHRVSWAINRGPIPDGLCALHKCDNRLCVNPGHLFLGTKIENNADRDRKGRQRSGPNFPYLPRVRGAAHGRSKITDAQALAIRNSSLSGVKLAKRYGISESTVGRIKAGQIWKHISSDTN